MLSIRRVLSVALTICLIVLKCNLILSQGIEDPEKLKEKEDTTRVFLNGKTDLSAFGGLIVNFSSFSGQFSIMSGAQIALLVKSKLYVGGYGLGLVSRVRVEPAENQFANLNFGHGGFVVGLLFRQAKFLHLSVGSRVGWGGISLNNASPFIFPPIISTDNVFLLEPFLELEANFTPWFKAGVGLGYRNVSGVDLPFLLNNGEMNSLLASATLTFGWFKQPNAKVE